MRKIFLILFFPVITLGAQGSGLTQEEALGQLNTITTAVPFLRIAPDARACGMGDGGVALSNDANAMYWNVSRLAFNKQRFGYSITYVPWLRAVVPDVNLAYMAAYFKPDSVSAIGISGKYFSTGKITLVSLNGVVINEYYPWEFCVDAGYSRKLNKNISAGISLRYIYSDIAPPGMPGTKIGKAYAGDIGFSWVSRTMMHGNCTGNLSAGLAITNVGSKISYSTDTNNIPDFIPINLGLSLGSEFNIGEKHFFAVQIEANKLLVPTPPIYATDSNGYVMYVNGQPQIAAGKDPNRSVWDGMTGSFNDAPGGAKEEFREIMWSGGVEYDYMRIVKARAGVFYEHALKGNRKYLTFGVGGHYKEISLDVAYIYPLNTQQSPLENSWKFTLLIHLDSFKSKTRKQPQQ